MKKSILLVTVLQLLASAAMAAPQTVPADQLASVKQATLAAFKGHNLQCDTIGEHRRGSLAYPTDDIKFATNAWIHDSIPPVYEFVSTFNNTQSMTMVTLSDDLKTAKSFMIVRSLPSDVVDEHNSKTNELVPFLIENCLVL